MNISKKKAMNILEGIYQIAYNATLTGALRGGDEPLVFTYNKIRNYAIKNGWVDEDLILEISEETMKENENWMADIGTCSKLFSKMLENVDVIENSETEEAKEYDENGYEK